MNILTISGSTRNESSNSKLLDSLYQINKLHSFERSLIHETLPLFKAEMDTTPLPEEVTQWRAALNNAEAVIICIPEYIHNLPALIKNALEWIASSGELVGKKVLAITLTPNEPRGEKAMQSLLWSLQAVDANVVASLPIFKNDITYGEEMTGDGVEMLREAIRLLD